MSGPSRDARPAPFLLGGPEIPDRRIPSDPAPSRDLCDAAEPDHEIQSLERALGALDAAIKALGSASAIVTERLDETVERVAMPNSRRAEQQLVTALNAARGAERCLRRRVELRGRALVRGHSGAVVAEDSGSR